jgi:hypothetical protein
MVWFAEASMKRLVLAVAVVAAMTTLAAAPALTAAEAKKQFFGFDMRGTLIGAEEPFRECIDKNGRTKFWFNGELDEGRMTVRPDGALCFSYQGRNFQDPACFAAYREGQNFRFVSDGGGTIWVTKSARKVASCQADVPVS